MKGARAGTAFLLAVATAPPLAFAQAADPPAVPEDAGQVPEEARAHPPLAPPPGSQNTQSEPSSPDCAALRHVLLVDGPQPLDPEFVAEVADELTTELSERGLSVCRTSSDAPAAAVVSLSRVDAKRILIDIEDRHTDKRISRGLSLSSLPQDGRALAVAVAIDELLRASWAELLLRESDSPPAVRKRPRNGRKSPRTSTTEADEEASAPADEPARARRPWSEGPWSMTASLLYQHTSRNWDALGGAMRTFYEFGAPFRVGGGLHAYHAGRITDELGSIAATGVGLDASFGACLGRGLRMCSDARLSLDYVSFDGRPNRAINPRTRDLSGSPLLAELALSAQWPSHGPVFGALEVSAGYAFHGVDARSDERTLLGLSGTLLGASLSVGVRP